MPPEFIDEKLPAEILSKLASFREFDKFCDVTLEADSSSKAESEPNPSTSIRAHKFVLAAASPYFRVLVDYMYTGLLDINEKNVKVLFGAASVLQLDSVLSECLRYLMGNLSISNWMETAAFAKVHNCTELDDAAVLFARQHFRELVESDELMSMDESNFLHFISDDRLNPKVYSSRDFWRAGPEMQRCRWGLGVTTLNGAIFTVGGYNYKQISGDTEMLDPRQGEWISLPSMVNGRMHFGLAAVNGLIYAAGGYGVRNGNLNSVEVYDPRACRWTTAQPMLKKRSCAGATVFRGQIVVVGGDDTNGLVHSSAEREAFKWQLYEANNNQQDPYSCGREEYFIIVFVFYKLKDIDDETLRVLVDYVYTGRLDINERNVRDLFGAAEILQLHSVRSECSRYLIEHLSISNWIETAALAKAHNSTELDDAAVLFARQHFGRGHCQNSTYPKAPGMLQLGSAKKDENNGGQAKIRQAENFDCSCGRQTDT
ncbi:unnamed protein product [Nippostrongylus brasiliensis]|uniref:Kelch-like protein 7 (inferred by orthology to a human protein) n=1 Tax=Nippostrongylus brasiliensis TaxID=27835 RepID=A0A158R0W7_NIPBR|nr:unnamed protein product [Nippostrongylus brasiliensis]